MQSRTWKHISKQCISIPKFPVRFAKRILAREGVYQNNVKIEIFNHNLIHFSNLSTHVRTVHEGKKEFKCEYCGKCFGVNQNLKQHIRIHLQDFKFKCEFCEKGFIRSQHLSRHLKTWHEKEAKEKILRYELIFVYYFKGRL